MAAIETRLSEVTQQESSSIGAHTGLLGLSRLSQTDRAAWRELLANRPDSAPFVDEAWVVAWSQAFGPRDPLVVCDWEEETGRLIGLGTLQSLTESWAGQRTAVLQSLTSVDSPRFEFLSSGGRRDVQEHLWRTLCTRRWDVIRVEHVPEDSPTLSVGLAVAEALGWHRILEETLVSPWRALPQPPGCWDEGLKRKFKANLRNRERRLQSLGAVTFEVVGQGADQQAALETFYALEASGWKGEHGTAIAQHDRTKAFYDGLRERTPRDVWIPIMTVAGRAAAAQLIRVYGRTLFLLKTAYDPAFAPYAPGQLLTARVMRYGVEHRMDAFDFLGDDMTWKQDWEPRLRRHYRLLLFAPSARGRYAYWTRHGIREHAKRIPGVTRLVRWLRAR